MKDHHTLYLKNSNFFDSNLKLTPHKKSGFLGLFTIQTAKDHKIIYDPNELNMLHIINFFVFHIFYKYCDAPGNSYASFRSTRAPLMRLSTDLACVVS